MASLSNPGLNINLVSGSSNADTVATIRVALTPFELFLINNAGLRLRLRCRLWGEDSGLTGDDDNLFTYPPQLINGAGEFTFRAPVSRATLDEDSGFLGAGEGDEIYARFTLQSLEPSFPINVSARSRNITGEF